MFKIPCVYGLIKAALSQIILAESQKMSQLMQKCRAHFIRVHLLFALRIIPQVFQEQNNLRRQHSRPAISKVGAGEQTKRICFNTITLQSKIRLALKRNRQLSRLVAQGPG